MTRQCDAAKRIVLILALTLIAEAGAAQPAGQERLFNQIYNRMVYIHTEGKADVYVNMPGHYDLGSPSISPDGKWIAFDAMTIGEKPIRESWLLGIDGKGLKKLTDGAVPRWSPDGKRILFTRSQL